MIRGIHILLVLFPVAASAQKSTITGMIQDSDGTKLPLAHIMVLPDSTITTSDTNGFFSVTTERTDISLAVSYTGYHTSKISLVLKKDTTVTITLRAKVDQLKEVEVVSQKYSQQDLFESVRSGTTTLTQDDINAIPVLGGEADIIRTLQLLPGTIRGIEGSADLFVRGGAADQNLLLLDDAPIYNSSHLFGFLSVFNPDILDKVDAVNGAFPAEYGGRLSSILDITTKNEIARTTKVSGDVGLIASRLFIEHPIIRNKASLWVTGRRTYIDQVVKAISDDELPYHFYDLNGKLVIQPTDRHNLQFSYYVGDDVLDWFRDRNNDGDGLTTTFASGNNSQTLRWSHAMHSGWNAHVTLIRSKYRYNITNVFEENSLLAVSDIEDIGARVLFEKNSAENKNTLKTGIDWTRHRVSPNVVNTSGIIAELVESSSTQGRTANELALHLQKEWTPATRWLFNAGLRLSSTILDAKTYVSPEPRFSMRYALNDNSSVKVSYSRMVQYLHRVSSSAVSAPTDIWYPVTEDIRPQTSHQISGAWQRFFSSDKLLVSVEAYYKRMDDLIGYEEGTNLFFNNDFESKLIQGKGKAYGFEFLVRKDAGNFTGWIGYTLSWSLRQFNEINQGEWFYSRYDRRHNGAVVAQYAFAKRWAVSTVWEVISGSRFTPVIGQYIVFAPSLTGVDLIPVYSGVNEVQLADTHRLDIGLKFKSKPDKKFKWQWFAGVYNAYNRANPVGINIEQDETDGSLRYEQPGLFGLIPFISYGFRF